MRTHLVSIQPALFDFPSIRKPIDRVADTVATYGPDALSDSQIIGIFFNSTNQALAEALVEKFDGIKNLLSLGPTELEAEGLDPREASRLASLTELFRRTVRSTERPRLTSPRAVGDYLIPRASSFTEERFGMLALNAKGDLLADRILSQGTATATMISPREFFREALRFGATSAVAWHNHPSTVVEPSREDIALTKKLRAAGEQIGVALADHIIVGGNRYYSFRAAEGWDANSS